jgi:hypothetical protein
MKRIILGLLFVFSITIQLPAQETRVVTTYWYYPAQNIYFSDDSGNYWFYDESRKEWVEASRLPSWVTMADTDPRYQIAYKGNDVWKQNKQHKVKYKVKKDGTVKVKNE